MFADDAVLHSRPAENHLNRVQILEGCVWSEFWVCCANPNLKDPTFQCFGEHNNDLLWPTSVLDYDKLYQIHVVLFKHLKFSFFITELWVQIWLMISSKIILESLQMENYWRILLELRPPTGIEIIDKILGFLQLQPTLKDQTSLMMVLLSWQLHNFLCIVLNA